MIETKRIAIYAFIHECTPLQYMKNTKNTYEYVNKVHFSFYAEWKIKGLINGASVPDIKIRVEKKHNKTLIFNLLKFTPVPDSYTPRYVVGFV